MDWSKREISRHIKAAKKLDKILQAVIDIIKHKKDLTEYDIQQYILLKYRQEGLATDNHKPIVAFGANTSFVHYYPGIKSKKLYPNTLIMIDIWAGLEEPRAPFADITWMLYYGQKIPVNVLYNFDIILSARDQCIGFIKSALRKKTIPTGQEIDQIARSFIAKKKRGYIFPHGTGHPLGFTKAHGRGRRINPRGRKALLKNVAYTIEPGIYFSDKYGIRSEIDFYITEKYQLNITTPVQRKIIIIKPNQHDNKTNI